MKISSESSSGSLYVIAITIISLVVSSALPVKSDAFPIVDTAGVYVKSPSRAIQTFGNHGLAPVHDHIFTRHTRSKPQFAVGTPKATSSEDTFGGTRNPMNIRGGDDTVSIIDKFKTFTSKNSFLLGMVFAVSFARLFPNLGKNGGVLRPELFIGKYGVTAIFLLSGLSLKVRELANAVKNMRLNALIQMMTFGAWPFLVGLPLTKGIAKFLPNLLPQPLLDGLLILTCLPTTVNMCIILTSASGGNVATALCNAVISNLAGIVLTPALLLRFFGKSIELPFVELVSKLCNKVLLPVAVGQALRATPMKDFYANNSKTFKSLQEFILLGICWNAFCEAFTRGLGLELRHGVALLVMLPILHMGSLALLIKFFRLKFLNFTEEESKAAAFCSSHKTLAFGLPLINTIFAGNPNLASYCAPLMFIHPLQLIIGSLAIPMLTKKNEE